MQSILRKCNKCTKELCVDPPFDDLFSCEKHFGFGSRFDGETLRIDLCDDCLEEVIHTFKIDPFI